MDALEYLRARFESETNIFPNANSPAGRWTHPFKIDDVISFTITGRIVRYSADKTGDCYTIYINNGRDRDSDIYLSTEDLIIANAKLIQEGEDG